MILFPNGETATTNFTFYEPPSGLKNVDRKKACNYIGNLNEDSQESTIAGSGCVHLKLYGNKNATKGVNKDEDIMYFTMLSKKTPNKKFFTLKNGKTEEVPSDGLDEVTMQLEKDYMKPSNFQSYGNAKLPSMIKMRRKKRQTGNFPKELKLNIAFGVDESIKEALGQIDRVENWVATVMCHMQSFYIHPSLKTKILFEVSI